MSSDWTTVQSKKGKKYARLLTLSERVTALETEVKLLRERMDRQEQEIWCPHGNARCFTDQEHRLYAEVKLLRERLDKQEQEMPACPKCGSRCEPITRTGKQLNPTAMYDAAEAICTVCPCCEHVFAWTL